MRVWYSIIKKSRALARLVSCILGVQKHLIQQDDYLTRKAKSGANEESIEHLFWKYSKTQQFLKEMIEKIQEMSNSLYLNERHFILGHFSQTHQIHF